MTACMINGGENGAFTNHLPWWHSQEVENIYRQCVLLMKELVPYKFSTLVDAHLHGGSLLKGMNFEEESHLVGNDIFTKAITSENNLVTFHLPTDGVWIDYWTGEQYQSGTLLTKEYKLSQFPLFIRAGAIIPINNTSKPELRVFKIYPGEGKSSRTFHLPKGEGIDFFNCSVSYDPQQRHILLDADESAIFEFIVAGKSVTIQGQHIDTYINN